MRHALTPIVHVARVFLVRSLRNGVSGWRISRKPRSQRRISTWVKDRADAEQLRASLQAGLSLDDAWARLAADRGQPC